MSKTIYYCPKDKNQILLVDPSGIFKMMVVESPLTCPKCKKSYYKWECPAKVVQEE